MISSQRGCTLKRLALLVVGVWIVILFYLSGSLLLVSSKEPQSKFNDALLEQYGRVLDDLNKLRKQNEELKNLLKQKESVPQELPSAKVEYSRNHEVERRSLDNSIRELYFYLKDQFSKKNASYVNHAMNHILSLLGQSSAFANVDNADEWRRMALSKIGNELQSRIHTLQNPSNCSSARKLICNLNKGCGFGCQLHHVAYCFIVAYGTNRTLLLSRDGRDWSYSSNGWTTAFLPVSSCSYDTVLQENGEISGWKGLEESKLQKVVLLPIVDGLARRPDFLPLAFPEEYSDELLKLHSNPPVFFISQFMRYLMRLSDTMQQRVEEAAAKIPFKDGFVVGLQIRRTDKVGTEAAFHSLDEYMKWAEDWFKVEEYRLGRSLKRRIFLATDDPSVFDEARKNYANYDFFGDQSVARSAQLSSRYTENSLAGVIIDIELLARCSYLVCTFSSQVCRMGYELMQVAVGDAGASFHSLDDLYYYGGQQSHEQVSVANYTAETPEEIDLVIGDRIGIAGNHWNGFSKGTNRRTKRTGLYPSYMAREKWIVERFP